MKRLISFAIGVFIFVVINVCSYADNNYDGYIVKITDNSMYLCSDDYEKIDFTEDLYVTDELHAKQIEKKDGVELIEPNYMVELFDEPNDEFYFSQWSLINSGFNDVYERKISANNAKIGIIDSGIYRNHPDLDGCISDDSYNVIDNSNNVEDTYGHGTFVAGIIGANANNNIGISGLATGAEITMIKCFDGKSTNLAYVISALNYANRLNLDVVNTSFGINISSQTEKSILLKEAVDNLVKKGTIVVAAVGNYNSADKYYPAGYDNVIGVGAVDDDFIRASYSQYNESVFITAPGSNIYSLWSPDAESEVYYKTLSGTSFAAPFVTSMVAYAKSYNPDLRYEEICELLKSSTKDNGDEGYDVEYGWGILNIKVFIDNLLGGSKVFSTVPHMELASQCTELHFFQNTVNRSGEDIHFIYAIYEDGHLTDVIESDFEDYVTIFLKYPLMPKRFKVRCFVWSNIEEIKPYYRCVTIE